MWILIYGIYTLITRKLQVTRHYGLKGKGAQWGGAILILFSLGFFSVLTNPIIILSTICFPGLKKEVGVSIVSFALQFILLAVVLVILVRIFGNSYRKVNGDTH